MRIFINRKTFETKEIDSFNSSLYYDLTGEDWIEYPYDEYDPEHYQFQSEDGGDLIFGDSMESFFNPSKSVQEIVDDISAEGSKYERAYGRNYDYVSLKFDTIEDCGSIYHCLTPVGVYKPTPERAVQWHKEKCEREKVNDKYEEDNIKNQIKIKEAELESLKFRLEEMNK